MKNIICYYDSENERVAIRADDIVIGELREIKVECRLCGAKPNKDLSNSF